MDTNITQYIKEDGTVDTTAIEQLRQLVDAYPFYHAARIMLLRLLYQQHDSSYSGELRRAALYLPSREAIFQQIEGEHFKPRREKDPVLSGATVARKAVSQLNTTPNTSAAQRTETLINGFLNTLPADGSPTSPADRRRARPIDASQDYMGFLLQQEESQRREAAQQAARQSKEESDKKSNQIPENGQKSNQTPENRQNSSRRSDDLMMTFINDTGDKRIRLRDSSEVELQKPVLVGEMTSGQGAFTEALARIYIKQGKFDHAIEIIHRLSLKYPKKNSYFADQIRFLEKLLENQRFLKGAKEGAKEGVKEQEN